MLRVFDLRLRVSFQLKMLKVPFYIVILIALK